VDPADPVGAEVGVGGEYVVLTDGAVMVTAAVASVAVAR